ncbi:hypothetical protein TNCV_2389351 [Trichonephila clavipes]|nr:hypothetical protein TNCV_2389351 [Trichonephila clavipes]
MAGPLKKARWATGGVSLVYWLPWPSLCLLTKELNHLSSKNLLSWKHSGNGHEIVNEVSRVRVGMEPIHVKSADAQYPPVGVAVWRGDCHLLKYPLTKVQNYEVRLQ